MNPPLLSRLIAATLLLAGYGFAQTEETKTLSTAAEIRALNLHDAARSRPVHLHGVVTFLAPNTLAYFVQDETGGVCVSGPRDKPLKGELKVGSVVDVDGVTTAGRVVPHVTARKREQLRVSVVGDAPLPEAKPATVAQLQQPAFQGVRVEISGVIRRVETQQFGQNLAEILELTLADQRDRVVVALPGFRNPNAPRQLIGATVRVRGVYNATGFERQPLFANRLFITGMREVQVIQPAGQPFTETLQSIEAARDAGDDPGQPDRILIHGTVTAAVPGNGMYVQNGTGAIFVEARNTAATGEQVEVAGFPAMRDSSPVIEDAVWREGKFPGSVVPQLITAEAALNPALDSHLVQIEALLLNTSSVGEAPTLVLQSGDRVFLARCANSRLKLPSLKENSWLRVTGVCVNTSAPQLRAAGGESSASFHLLMPGPQAIEIAHAPNWWTLRRLFAVVGTMAVLAIAAVVWATTLRRRVAEQTAQIREHLAREAVAQERLRIAGELHDSVQQDLLGITMQLKATDRLLDASPERAREALTIVNAMVRHSQAETHRAVWDLRASAQEQVDLVISVDEMLAGLNSEENATVSLVCHGDSRPLPQAIERQVLRITQEAVCNALKHAAAQTIEVELRFSPTQLTLVVRDDGRGFDADHPPLATAGHFGLLGMQERAVKLNADLRVTSQPGSGTSVQLDVPLPAEEEKRQPERMPTPLQQLLARPTTS